MCPVYIMIPVCGQTQMWSTPTSKCLCGSQLVHVCIPVLYVLCNLEKICSSGACTQCCVLLYQVCSSTLQSPMIYNSIGMVSLTYLQWHLALSVFLVLNLKLRNNSSTAYNNKSSIQHCETHSTIKFYFKLT